MCHTKAGALGLSVLASGIADPVRPRSSGEDTDTTFGDDLLVLLLS